MLAPTRWRFRRPVAAVVTVVVLVLAVTVVLADRWSKEKSIPIQGNVASAITTADLTAVARTRVFFGHFSVGMTRAGRFPASMRITVSRPPRSSRGVPSPAPTAGSSPTNSSANTLKPLTSRGLRPHHAPWDGPAGRRRSDEVLLG